MESWLAQITSNEINEEECEADERKLETHLRTTEGVADSNLFEVAERKAQAGQPKRRPAVPPRWPW